MTDTKGRHAERGWICFDRDCTICTSLARRFRRTFEKRGFGLAALQDPRVAALLALPPDQVLQEMRVITTTGEIHGGAEAIVYLAKQVWWAWPIFAVAMAQSLSISRVLIPPSAGVFSSYGLLYSGVAYHFTRSRKALLSAVDPAEIDAILGELETHARTRLAEDGFAQDQIALERAAALHYQGQSFELEVPMPAGTMDRAALAARPALFSSRHAGKTGSFLREGPAVRIRFPPAVSLGRGVAPGAVGIDFRWKVGFANNLAAFPASRVC